jgi:two pore calcium channel protein
LKDELKGFYGCQTRGLALAFSKLRCESDRGTVKVAVFEELLKTLSGFPKMTKSMQGSSMEKVLRVIDDGSGELSFAQFSEACDILLYSFSTTPMESFIVRKYGWTRRCVWIRDQIDSGRLEYFMNWLLALNAAFIVVESTYDILNLPQPYLISPLEMFFSCIYIVEVVMKLTVTSFGTYWSNAANRFEFLVSWLLFFAGIATVIPMGKFFWRLLPYLNILRIVRLVRLLERIPRFKMMFRCIFKLLLVSKEMVLLVMITMLSFAVLGVQIFGGLLYPTNPILEQTDFVTNNYSVLGFNDVASALVAMFCMMVCNYMPTYAIAMDRVAAFHGMGLLFCIVFFLFGVNIVFNVFTAFTIDVFLTLKEAQEQIKDAEAEGTAQMEDRIVVEMQELVTQDNQILHVKKPAFVLQKKTLLKVFHDVQDQVLDIQDEVGRRVSRADIFCQSFHESSCGNLRF